MHEDTRPRTAFHAAPSLVSTVAWTPRVLSPHENDAPGPSGVIWPWWLGGSEPSIPCTPWVAGSAQCGQLWSAVVQGERHPAKTRRVQGSLRMTRKCCAGLLLVLAIISARANEPTIAVDQTSSPAKVSPLFYGLMTEEINHAYDGGLYAELVQNRAFLDDERSPAHWSARRRATAPPPTIALDRRASQRRHRHQPAPRRRGGLRRRTRQASPTRDTGGSRSGRAPAIALRSMRRPRLDSTAR